MTIQFHIDQVHGQSKFFRIEKSIGINIRQFPYFAQHSIRELRFNQFRLCGYWQERKEKFWARWEILSGINIPVKWERSAEWVDKVWGWGKRRQERREMGKWHYLSISLNYSWQIETLSGNIHMCPNLSNTPFKFASHFHLKGV